MEEKEPYALFVGMQSGTFTMEDTMEVPKKLKTELPYDPLIPFLSITSKGNYGNTEKR